MIYLDSAATTPVKAEVMQTIINAMNNYWENPSSVYENGLEARRKIEDARCIIAKSINAEPDEIIFTSGASESNALAVDGFIKSHPHTYFITSNIEHSSIPMFKADSLVEVSPLGDITESQLASKLHGVINKNKLVSIMWANNEIGTVNDMKALSKAAHHYGAILHTDATQYFPYYKIDVKEIGVDMMSVSGHKFGCPKGIGFLYVKKGIELSPIIYGTQENGVRGGTYNTPYIVGLAKAVELLDYSQATHIREVRDYCLQQLCELDIPNEIGVNGCITSTLPNIINFRIKDIDAKSLVAFLSMYGVCVSAGSACHAGDKQPSHVLKALGLSDNAANESIRISVNEHTTYKEIDVFIKTLKMVLAYC